MATPEERKSKLQAAWKQKNSSGGFNFNKSDDNGVGAENARIRAQERKRLRQQDEEIHKRLAQKAPELYAPKRQYADPGSFAGKMLPGGAPNQLKQLDLSGLKQQNPSNFNSLHASRASALASNRFQQGLSSTPPLIRSQFDEQQGGGISRTIDDDTARRLGMGQEQNDGQQQAQRLAGIQAGVNAQTQRRQAQSQQSQQADEKTQQQRDELKQTAKAAVRRGGIFVMDTIAAAFDMGSSGISFIIDIFIYMFTLGWLNLEMIYGKYLMKGKSKYVGPISWAPIPMPVDKDAIILSGFVVAADIALGIAVLVLTFGGFCFLHDMVKVTSSVTQAFSIGASLAQGEAGGLCLGGIITSAFGL